MPALPVPRGLRRDRRPARLAGVGRGEAGLRVPDAHGGAAAEVRLATWDEFDLGAMMWTIPDTRMKAQREHRAPSVSAVAMSTAVEHAVSNADSSRRLLRCFEVAA